MSIETVRLLIADTDPNALILTDDQITALLGLHADAEQAALLAAADALDAIATSEALLSKKIRTQDLSTDGPAVAAELRKHAAQLRDRAAGADAFDGFDLVPSAADPLAVARVEFVPSNIYGL